MRLIYHPESDCYFYADDSEELHPLCEDVTGIENHELEAGKRLTNRFELIEPIAQITNLTSMKGTNLMGNILTPEFRASFVYAFRPQASLEEGKEPKYSVTMLFKKGADLTALKKVAHQAAVEKWGDKIPPNLYSPFRDQGEKDYDGYEAGAIFLTATSKQKPGVVDQNVQDIINEADFYSGCWARATVRAFAYGGAGTKFKAGVGFGLQNIQKLRDDKPLGGRTRATDDFAPVEMAAGETASSLFD